MPGSVLGSRDTLIKRTDNPFRMYLTASDEGQERENKQGTVIKSGLRATEGREKSKEAL